MTQPPARPAPPPAEQQALLYLLDTMDADASQVQRHLWLIRLMDWIRGDGSSADAAVARVGQLITAVEADPATTIRLQVWWRTLLDTVDGTTLLSDYGFASRNAFVSELVERLHYKLLPVSPETTDASDLFALVMPSALDAAWLAALPGTYLERLAELLSAPASGMQGAAHPKLTYWQNTLLEAMTFCTSQIRAAGFSPEIRLRMSVRARDASPFHTLASDFDTLRDAWLAQLDGSGSGADLAQAVNHFRTRLDACRNAASTVYTHLDAHGISVDLVFRLRQLRERVMRIRALLDCLLVDPPHVHTALLMSHLASVGQDQRSLRALFSNSTSLLAAKVAERSSEVGEHYITRTRSEYRGMLRSAAGGGALTALTTGLKFAIMAVGLTAFWNGFWSGLMYAASFVLIQLLHCTLATKQPAMTAPAMAAKLRDFSDAGAMHAFVDEVTHLVRSQVAAVLGNVVVVFPAVLLISGAMQLAIGRPMISAEAAAYVFQSLTLLGPCLLFAAFTGVLLFASSILAGWVENWFVLHRLDSALRYNPHITRRLGVERADRWALFMRQHISGFASNISLGFMLGLFPAIFGFLGLGLDVRHVTLSTGQLAAACAALGWDVVRNPALWWAVASIPFIGALNLSVSFYLAFRVALQAHSVTGLGRVRIRRAVLERLRSEPMSFLRPAREEG
ncbi:site-specific recombinase [Rhodoferax sp. AJA081-3]|uniref:site-specific recombinase n=1 Tax=Rhodoferax sp. AJA081-3 TaxID=2752316 RepID=UPI001AE02C67|nr:site-specific recombinase [Rhodoferax sp. AJA081-3]QTN30354.1 site-specific recombinase [Rhodoferax sp. AJA081-3]